MANGSQTRAGNTLAAEIIQRTARGVQPSVELYSLHEPNIMKSRTSAEGAYSQGLSSAGNYSTAIYK